ncbi:MAG: hypothetical protein CM15mP60_1270 [Alphaproteobacteria bacterium]|nr:MAG: hypothetical protein CM15mP60_1270 [Alphaproteobacteria bacterium]
MEGTDRDHLSAGCRCGPEFPGFAKTVTELGEITREDTSSWAGYLAAHRARRAYFKSFGATATDHGHASARTADLPPAEAEALFARCWPALTHLMRRICSADRC